MGISVGTPLLVTLTAAAVFAAACGHLTKYKVEEVPISSFQPTGPPPTATTDEAGRPPIIDMGPSTTATTTTGAAPSTVVASSAAGPAAQPVAIGGDEGDSSDAKIQLASKLLKSGKRTDLAAARKLLSSSVFGGTGTPDQARLLRLVCSKLGDKPCVTRCSAFIR